MQPYKKLMEREKALVTRYVCGKINSGCLGPSQFDINTKQCSKGDRPVMNAVGEATSGGDG